MADASFGKQVVANAILDADRQDTAAVRAIDGLPIDVLDIVVVDVVDVVDKISPIDIVVPFCLIDVLEAVFVASLAATQV